VQKSEALRAGYNTRLPMSEEGVMFMTTSPKILLKQSSVKDVIARTKLESMRKL
jgi:hypothetical protein